MCSPGVALGLQATGAVGNYIQQDRYSRKMADFQEAQGRAVSADATESAIRQFSRLNRADAQEARDAARAVAQISREARRVRGDFKTTAMASGVSGASVETSLADFEAQEYLRIQTALERSRINRDNIQTQKENISDQATQIIRQAVGGPIQGPSPFNALFQIAGAAVNYGIATDAPQASGATPER